MIRQPASSWWRQFLVTISICLAAALPAGADPTILYSTFLGGNRLDTGRAVAVNGSSTFVAGTTRSLNFPVRFPPSGLSSSKPNQDEVTLDVFLTYLNSSGVPVYSRYIPMGPNHHGVLGVGAGPGGVAYVVGLTFFGSDADVFVVRVDPPGRIAWTQDLFGRRYAERMTVDPQGNVYVTGRNNSESQSSPSGYIDAAFVWKIGPDGSTIYLTDIDGNGFDIGRGIAADSAGYAYITGATTSTNLPNALQAVPVGGNNVFITKLGPTGDVRWTTYLGGSGDDWGEEIEIAADNTVVVAGTTNSPNFNIDHAIQDQPGGSRDLFVARLQSWGSRLSSTYLGGSGSEDIRDLALEPSGILLAVQSPEPGSPLREPLDPACGDSFVAKLDTKATTVLDAACLGGSIIYGVAADSSGVSLTGAAASDMPRINSWQPGEAGGGDAFAAKIVFDPD
jgi:hypothetical protein